MKATWNDKVIAQSSETIVIENNHYFPISSIGQKYFIDSDHTSYCPWKGEASYYSISVDGKVNANAAWYYKEPEEKASEIRGMVAFWRGVEVSA
ncbi:MAG: hypothetical protein ACI9Y1_003629 [Lentisphaeria bacterium]|jgi:uncharacterized protein (DUF427 family)